MSKSFVLNADLVRQIIEDYFRRQEEVDVTSVVLSHETLSVRVGGR